MANSKSPRGVRDSRSMVLVSLTVGRRQRTEMVDTK